MTCRHTLREEDEVECPEQCSGKTHTRREDGEPVEVGCLTCHGCGTVPRMVPCPDKALRSHRAGYCGHCCDESGSLTGEVPAAEAVIEVKQNAAGDWLWRIIPGGGMRVQSKTDGFYWKHREATHNAALAAARKAGGE